MVCGDGRGLADWFGGVGNKTCCLNCSQRIRDGDGGGASMAPLLVPTARFVFNGGGRLFPCGRGPAMALFATRPEAPLLESSDARSSSWGNLWM